VGTVCRPIASDVRFGTVKEICMVYARLVMRDTDEETVKVEILRGMWAARPAELRKAEHIEGYRESMKRMYPNLLPSGDEGSRDTFRKLLEGLIV
jgi:hypothetical protein